MLWHRMVDRIVNHEMSQTIPTYRRTQAGKHRFDYNDVGSHFAA
jgi:hypothetical protein